MVLASFRPIIPWLSLKISVRSTLRSLKPIVCVKLLSLGRLMDCVRDKRGFPKRTYKLWRIGNLNEKNWRREGLKN